ncbi:MAG: lyase family protein, partial [Chloroflexi bacterium]|nr:lyase family protein [Chloroflexota bacterium]
MAQQWSERFAKPLDVLVAEFNASISFDQRLAEEDIAGSIAHARMLGRQGIVPEPEIQLIVRGLEAIREEIRAGTFQFRLDREDIHFNIEAALTERIGPIAGKLHTGRSRNDQVALDISIEDVDTRQISLIWRINDCHKSVSICHSLLQYRSPRL